MDGREIKQKQVCVTNLQSSNVQDVHANATRMLLVLISSNVSTMPKLACSVCQGRHSIRSNTDVAGSKQKRRFLLRKTRRADFDTEVKICTALGIAAIAFLPFVLSSSNFCSEYGKTLRL